jgi:hypothetical protein
MQYPHSVEQTFLLAFERLQQRNRVAAEILTLCCFLAADDIPEFLPSQGACHLGEKLQMVLSDPFQLQDIFQDLLTSTLLYRNVRTQTFRVHRLVQIVLKEQLPEATQRAWVRRLVTLLDQLFLITPGRLDLEQWTRCEQLLPHVYNVLHMNEHFQLTLHEAGSLLQKVAVYLLQRRFEGQVHDAGLFKQQRREQEAKVSKSRIQKIPMNHQKVLSSATSQLPIWNEETGGETETERDDTSELTLFVLFLKECCVLCAQAVCPTADLWQAYKLWAQDKKPSLQLSRQAFTFHLEAKGCSRVRTRRQRFWRGIRLKQ